MSATIRQLQVMKVLQKAGPEASLRELGEKLEISHVSVVLMLKRLTSAGYVKGRELTDKGREALKNATADLRASLADVA